MNVSVQHGLVRSGRRIHGRRRAVESSTTQIKKLTNVAVRRLTRREKASVRSTAGRPICPPRMRTMNMRRNKGSIVRDGRVESQTREVVMEMVRGPSQRGRWEGEKREGGKGEGEMCASLSMREAGGWVPRSTGR